MGKVYTVEDIDRSLEFARKKAAFKRKVRDGLNKTGEWIYRNKEMVIFFTPIVVGGLGTLVRVVFWHSVVLTGNQTFRADFWPNPGFGAVSF